MCSFLSDCVKRLVTGLTVVPKDLATRQRDKELKVHLALCTR